MRLLALGISALALGACSVGGGYSWNGGHAGYDTVTTAGYGYGACNADPCAGYVPPAPQPMPVPMPQPGPCYVNPCAPVYTPPPPPQPVPPAPCHNPCAGGSYAVSPYAYGASTPDAHAYGTHVGSHVGGGYGSYAAPAGDYLYTTLGAVWYDIDNPYGGVQGRLGYQSAGIFGGEIEGSIGVINEKSPFDQANPPGPNLVGEFNDGIKHSLAGFGVARLPFSPAVSAHARVGYHSTKAFNDVIINGVELKNTTTRDGIAYGAGLEFNMSPVDAIRADYTRYEDDTDGMDSVSLAWLRRF